MADGRKGSERSYNLFQLAVFLSTVLFVMTLMGAIIFSMAFVLYGGVSYHVYLGGSIVSAGIILGSMIVSNRWNGRLASAVYLISMTVLASYLYALVATLLLSLALLAAALTGMLEALIAFFRFAFPLLIICPLAYGSVEARFLRERKLELETGKGLGQDVTVFFFSDLHIGNLVGRKRLAKIVGIAERVRPDLILIGGDLYDTDPINVPWSERYLRTLSGLAPTYMVTGNHDSFHGIDECLSKLKTMGIMVLRGDAVKVGELPVVVGGLDDPSDMPRPRAEKPPIPVPGGGDECYKIFTYHRPQRFAEAVRAGYDLQLSGHTHWGQIAPFNLATYLAWGRYFKGLHELGGSYMYTSSGAWTWGPPLRVFAPAEVLVVHIKPR